MYARRWRETIWESTSVSSSPSKGTYHKRCEEWKTTEMASSHLENLYDENHDTTDIQTCYVSRQPAMNYKKKMYVCDSTEKTASIDRLRYNREQVSNLFFIHENTTQELNRTDICLTTTQPCIGHMSPVIVPKSAMYCSRFACWLNEASVICRTHCGTQFNWRKAHFSITHSKISPTRDEWKISSMRDEWKFCNGELLQ